MNLAFKRVKVYVRAGLLLVVAIAIITVLMKNRGNTVSVWFFGLTQESQQINVVWLMLCTAAATLIAWWVFSLVWGLLRDMRDVRLKDAQKKAEQALRQREEELAARERKVDQKVRGEIAREEGDA